MSSSLVFNRVYRLEIQSVMLVFSTPFVKYCPSRLLTNSPPPLPLFPVLVYVFIHTVYNRGEGGDGWVVWKAYTLIEIGIEN
jgi:hypothetical protein